ncbi:MAG: hypothetical protein ACXW4H_04245 [Candidatus Limnocylindrales bacterium]
MNPIARYAIAAVAIVVLAGGMLYVFAPGQGSVGGPPSAAPLTTASPSARTSAAPSPAPFTSSNFKVPIGFTLLDGWTISTDELGTVGLQLGDAAAAIVSIDSLTVRGATPTAPWVPWPDDIHAWLAGRPEFRPDAPRAAEVGGRPAVVIDADYVRERITDQGDWLRYGTGQSDGLNLKGSWPGRVHLVVVKTGVKSGIVVVMDAPVDAFDQASVSLDRILATLTFR